MMSISTGEYWHCTSGGKCGLDFDENDNVSIVLPYGPVLVGLLKEERVIEHLLKYLHHANLDKLFYVSSGQLISVHEFDSSTW